jgi:hypothetical protein
MTKQAVAVVEMGVRMRRLSCAVSGEISFELIHMINRTTTTFCFRMYEEFNGTRYLVFVRARSITSTSRDSSILHSVLAGFYGSTKLCDVWYLYV